MKKFAMTAVAVAAVLGAGAANAYTSGTFQNGFVVPNVIKQSNGSTTTVGIVNMSGGSVPVFWTFFDQDSVHKVDGCFIMTDRDYEPFVWGSKLPGQTSPSTGIDDLRGYLVFVTGNTGTATAPAVCNKTTSAVGNGKISGNAFFVDPTNKDVAFTPVIDGPLEITGNLSLMDEKSLTKVGGAAQIPVAGGANTPTFAMRYYIDGAAGGTDTSIVVWSTGDQRGSYTTFIYDDKQNSQSVNFDLKRAELDWFNPETIIGRPADFLDGFIEWKPSSLPAGAPTSGSEGPLVTKGGSVFTYSVMSSPAFSAVQTVLGAHTTP